MDRETRYRPKHITNRIERRHVLRMLGAGGIAGLAGCLGNDGVSASSTSESTDDDGDSMSSDSEPTDDDGDSTPLDSEPTDDDDENSSPSPTAQPTGDGTAPVDLRMFPPNHNMDSFSSFLVEYESLVLTTTGGEEVTIPVEQTVSLKSDSTATGVPVAENLAVPVGEYEIIEVHYSLDQTVTSDGQTAEIEFTSPESVNIAELSDEPTTIEESNPYVLQTHFGLVSEPWKLSMPTIILGPGIPD